MEQLPVMRQAGCNFLAFGVEAGTQKVLDRLIRNKPGAGGARGPGSETAGDRQGARLLRRWLARRNRNGHPGELPLRGASGVGHVRLQSAVRLSRDAALAGVCGARIIDDVRDWHKWFKCTDIDPTTLPSAVVNGCGRKLRLLFFHRVLKRPIRTWKLLRAFGRHMKTSDLLKLLASPFRRRP